MQSYDIHPELGALNGKLPFGPLFLRVAVPFMRLLPDPKLPDALAKKEYRIEGFKGLPVKVELFEPRALCGNAPAMLYLHGGGFGLAASAHHKEMAQAYAEQAGCRVFFPDYHLLPKHPFPAAREDSLSVWRWMEENANALSIDKNKMAVAGDSAGGLLALDVANLAAARGLVAPCFQMLIYPATDWRMETESMKAYTDTPMWNAKNNKIMWDMYLKDIPSEQKDAACPAYTPLPEILPPAYLETAEFDPLHDEGAFYAKRLLAAGGEVELVETKRTIHGYDVAHDCSLSKENLARRIRALKKAFGQ